MALLPLLNRWISVARPAGVPPEVAREASTRAQLSALGGLRLTGELISLTRILEAAGVPVLALKGPALAVRAYGDVALRPQNDIDLLVRPKDIDRALEALATGRLLAFEDPGGGPGGGVPRDRVPPCARRPERHLGGTALGDHQATVRTSRSTTRPGGRDQHLVSLGGTQVRSLCNECTLVYLALHGGKHEWNHLRWVGDVAGVARLQPMDWDRVYAMAARSGTLRMTRLALALVARPRRRRTARGRGAPGARRRRHPGARRDRASAHRSRDRAPRLRRQHRLSAGDQGAVGRQAVIRIPSRRDAGDR